MMKNKNYSESKKFAAVERFLVGGESVATIAADTGISRSTLYAWIKSLQIEPAMLDFTLKNFWMLVSNNSSIKDNTNPALHRLR